MEGNERLKEKQMEGNERLYFARLLDLSFVALQIVGYLLMMMIVIMVAVTVYQNTITLDKMAEAMKLLTSPNK